MKKWKFLSAFIGLSAVLSVALTSCSPAGLPAVVEKTSEPVAAVAATESVSYRALDLRTDLGPYHDFIFRGTIISIAENDLAVCKITVEDVLYGTAAKAGQTINVVTDQTSDRRISAQMLLFPDHEYFFLTHVLDDIEKPESKDSVPYDVSLYDSIYAVMPILGDFVYLNSQWPIAGAKPAELPAFVGERGITSSVPLKQFEPAFRELIEQYKQDAGK